MEALKSILSIASSGMRAQGERIKIISENVANANSLGSTSGEDPYQRKTISFVEMVDKKSGASLVDFKDVGRDQSDFKQIYDPSHPAADETGYVKGTNVNTLIEMANMREASRSYEANLNMFEAGRRMRNQLIDLLK
ncbi:MAG: flagellar basal body rod protein FlgC [Rhodobacteraceae bacterium]|nr:flagellar basal body rod protein FlgC [Paracoccaceae bacterium]